MIRTLCLVIYFFCSFLSSLASVEVKRTLYPPIEPHQTGYLAVEGGHNIYWEECDSRM